MFLKNPIACLINTMLFAMAINSASAIDNTVQTESTSSTAGIKVHKAVQPSYICSYFLGTQTLSSSAAQVLFNKDGPDNGTISHNPSPSWDEFKVTNGSKGVYRIAWTIQGFNPEDDDALIIDLLIDGQASSFGPIGRQLAIIEQPFTVSGSLMIQLNDGSTISILASSRYTTMTLTYSMISIEQID